MPRLQAERYKSNITFTSKYKNTRNFYYGYTFLRDHFLYFARPYIFCLLVRASTVRSFVLRSHFYRLVLLKMPRILSSTNCYRVQQQNGSDVVLFREFCYLENIIFPFHTTEIPLILMLEEVAETRYAHLKKV